MDSKGKNTFILYTEQWEALKCLTDAQLGKLFRCLYNLMLGTLQMSDVTDDIRVAFMFLKTQINIDKIKYEKRVESSKKAAEIRWTKIKNMRPHATAYDRMPNDNVYDNDNGNVDVNVNENDNAAALAACDSADGKPPSAPAAAAANLEGEKKKKPLTDGQIKQIVAWFNYYMQYANIPIVRKITPEREKLIREIAEAHPWEEVKKVFILASQSDFLNGRTKRQFLASFDWIMKEDNFYRILEGIFKL